MGAAAREWRQDDTVGQRQRAQFQGIEQAGHGNSNSGLAESRSDGTRVSGWARLRVSGAKTTRLGSVNAPSFRGSNKLGMATPIAVWRNLDLTARGSRDGRGCA